MSPAEFSALLPLLILAASAALLTAVAGFYRNHGFVAGFPMAAFVLSFFALFFMGLTFAASFVLTLLSYGYNGGAEGRHTEYYILLMLSALGAAVLAASRHFASFFLGLETLSVSLFGLVAYMRTARGNEADRKSGV